MQMHWHWKETERRAICKPCIVPPAERGAISHWQWSPHPLQCPEAEEPTPWNNNLPVKASWELFSRRKERRTWWGTREKLLFSSHAQYNFPLKRIEDIYPCCRTRLEICTQKYIHHNSTRWTFFLCLSNICIQTHEHLTGISLASSQVILLY